MLLHVLIVTCTLGVYMLQAIIQTTFPDLAPFTGYLTTALNAIQSLVFENVYQTLKDILTEFENHRTQTDYDDSIIIKNAIFTFVNTFVSFFYIAFIAGKNLAVLFGGTVDETGCVGYDSCMQALEFNMYFFLISVAISQSSDELSDLLYISDVKAAFADLWIGKSANAANLLHDEHPYKRFADQYFRLDSSGSDGSAAAALSDHYTALFKQFGFIVMFAVAAPLAAALCFFSNWIELLGDLKSFATTLRGIPVGAQDIGVSLSYFMH